MLKFSEYKLFEQGQTGNTAENKPVEDKPVAPPAKTNKELPALNNIEQKVANVKKKVADKKRKTISVKMVKDVDFKIEDNAYFYNFKYIGANPNARTPYFSFTTNNKVLNSKVQFVYVPKQQYDAMNQTLTNLAKISQAKPEQVKDDTIVSAIKANLIKLGNDQTPIGENNVKLGGLSKEVAASVSNFINWFPNLVKNNTSYSQLKELPNKVKAEENNYWMIRKSDGKPYLFEDTIKIGDKIKLSHYVASEKRWDIINNIIIVKTISKTETTTF
jgi:hypothetical protein